MRAIGRFFLYLLALIGVLAVAVAAGLVWALLQLRPEVPAPPDEIVVTLDLSRGIVERPKAGLLQGIGGEGPLVLRDVVAALDAAKADPRVKGLVLYPGEAAPSLAHAQQLRRAVARFRESGKFAWAWSESFGGLGNGTVAYYLATSAGQVWMQPSGTLGMIGVAIETPFVAGALDKLDIGTRYDQRHEYKGAGEMFVRRGFSPEARETLGRLVDSWMAQIVEAVAEARGIRRSGVRALIETGPQLAGEAKEAKLVDELGYLDTFEEKVAELAGPGAAWLPVDRYLPVAPAPAENGTQVALIYGTGAVVPGKERDGPFDTARRLGAETVAAAIDEAVEDPAIRAILLRIDSPGGAYGASDMVWRAIRRAREAGKPVVTSLGSMAASGGYFIAMAADGIVAEPATVTGSIGVFTVKFVTRDFWREFGIDWDRVQSGPRASLWSMIGEYPPGGRERVNEILDAVYADFTAKVGAARDLSAEQVDAVARGRVWSGRDAKARGLVDALGGFGTAVGLLREKLGLDAAAPVSLVELPRPSRFEQVVRELQKRGVDIEAAITALRGPSTPDLPVPAATLRRLASDLPMLAPPVGVLQMPPIRLAD